MTTGTLAPSFGLKVSNMSIGSSIDYIFTHYWTPANEVMVLTPEEERCVQQTVIDEYKRFDPKSVL